MKKRILAIVLTGVLLLGTVPAMAAKVLPYGDVDDSGVIDAGDALRILQYSVEKSPLRRNRRWQPRYPVTGR